MLTQETGDGLCIAVGAFHADLQRFQRAAEHPAGMRIELRADGAAQRLHLLHHRLAAKRRAGDQVGMAADIFGQRIERDIGAMLDRALEDRAEQRVVTGDDRHMALLFTDHVGDTADHGDIDEAVGRVRRRFNEDDRDAPLAHRLLGRRPHRVLADAIGETDGVDAEIEEGLRQQRFGAAIERLRMQDGIARPHEGEQRRGDRRHAGRKQGAAFRPLIDRQPILDDLAVGVIEARIDEAGALAFRRLLAAGDVVEEVAPVLGGVEHEGRRQEDRRLDRAFGQLGIVTVVQHLRFGMQGMVADMGSRGMRRSHETSPRSMSRASHCKLQRIRRRVPAMRRNRLYRTQIVAQIQISGIMRLLRPPPEETAWRRSGRTAHSYRCGHRGCPAGPPPHAGQVGYRTGPTMARVLFQRRRQIVQEATSSDRICRLCAR